MTPTTVHPEPDVSHNVTVTDLIWTDSPDFFRAA
jgi:hypothetical protein